MKVTISFGSVRVCANNGEFLYDVSFPIINRRGGYCSSAMSKTTKPKIICRKKEFSNMVATRKNETNYKKVLFFSYLGNKIVLFLCFKSNKINKANKLLMLFHILKQKEQLAKMDVNISNLEKKNRNRISEFKETVKYSYGALQ